VVATWDRATNARPLKVEAVPSAASLPLNWNISVSHWLRIYVYERMTGKHRKGGFKEVMATQITSAIWHGLYPGYILMFVGTGLMMFGSRVLYRYQQGVPEHKKGVKVAFAVAQFLYANFCNNYAPMGFILLGWRETFSAWSGVYYFGTLIPIAVLVWGQVFPPKRRKLKPSAEVGKKVENPPDSLAVNGATKKEA